MFQSWVVNMYLDCPTGLGLHCPNATQIGAPPLRSPQHASLVLHLSFRTISRWCGAAARPTPHCPHASLALPESTRPGAFVSSRSPLALHHSFPGPSLAAALAAQLSRLWRVLRSATFEAAVRAGDITWHAFPHNAQLEIMDPVLIQAGVQLTHDLDVRRPLPPYTHTPHRRPHVRHPFPDQPSASLCLICLVPNPSADGASLP